MTAYQNHSARVGVQEIADALRSRLQRYIEAAYYLRDQSVVEERRILLSEPDAITRKPFIETTPSYALGLPYSKLNIPTAIGDTLSELAGWEPGLGIFPHPYRHQAEALEAFFTGQHDLIVSTGTGSGKTETFLLPIIGSLIDEAAQRPKSFLLSGCRALLLYPMNALVSDQISRLRRIIGDARLRKLFQERYKRHPRFGMYTSRTPYPGQRDSNKDHRHLSKLLSYYLNLEAEALRDGPTSKKALLVDELRQRGRWPAKDLESFFGKPGDRWERRLQTQPDDSELLTRHEMQISCPDILITNYSMLEYMLMRPIELSIFDQTRSWLASNPSNNLILVIDEAHLYRGTAGAEVAYLIRRLQARLDIPRERMRCILTSASLGPDQTVEADVQTFAKALTGTLSTHGRSFRLIRGYREPRPEAQAGTAQQAQALALFDKEAFSQHVHKPEKAYQAVAALSEAIGWPTPALASEHHLRTYLYKQLYGFGPAELLILESTGQAKALETLAECIFPGSDSNVALQATEALLTLGTYAHNRQMPLLQTRIHLLFRGLPSLWACVNQHCTARLSQTSLQHVLGRIYTEPRTQCECGARVYEMLVHRDCGAVFLRAFGEGDSPNFYWHEAGRMQHTDQPLQEHWLIVEQPLRRQEQQGLIEPFWMDTTTGRVAIDPPADLDHYHQMWRSASRAAVSDKDNEQDSEAGASYLFSQCPVCARRTPDKILDLATRGERPFANLVHEQFLSQVPSRPFSADLPNGGRKVLLFADGRQKAARLARDLPREVEFDTFRQAIALAVWRLENVGREPTLGQTLYTAFVSVCHDLRLHFFDQEDNSQTQLLNDMRDFDRFYDADLGIALNEEETPFSSIPMRYRQHLFDQIANPFYSVYSLATIIVKPSKSSLRKLKRTITATLPAAVTEELETITTFWLQILLERGAFDKSLPSTVRDRVTAYARPPKTGAVLRDLEKILVEASKMSSEQMKQLRTALYDVFTEQGESLAYLKPTTLRFELAFDKTWLKCTACGNVQHAPLLGRCAICGDQTLVQLAPDDPIVTARYNYYREPLREVLRGIRPAHLTAEEHTAQLSQRDSGAVYATTEEFELRFQDIALGDDKPPVDVLSCTTTMEVGIDIGSLVAIGMRNVPPQRENYQQRAGRAGRRGSAISTVVSYADSGPHDHFYYHHPEGMIAGDPRRPLLSIERQTLARRHICAYLLQTFFHEQLDELSIAERNNLMGERRHLLTALGSKAEFFSTDGALNFNAFQSWVNAHVYSPDGRVARKAALWLPDEIAAGGMSSKMAFVAETAKELINKLSELGPLQEQQDSPPTEQNRSDEPKGLLDTLFDAGLLPSYAFPIDLVSFYVFGRDGDQVIIKERPQQSKVQALSEYAPGRLLVINKETYRVGGIYVFNGGHDRPAQKLFEHPLQSYIYCPSCTYVRLEPLRGREHCAICQEELRMGEMLDPPGFSPANGRPVGERDREQEISYSAGAQLPLPLASDQLIWHDGAWPNIRYSYAEGQRFVIVNRGPDAEGFTVCEECGATWPTANAPRRNVHERPYLVPPRFGSGRCCGALHAAPVYLGTTFRSDLLLIRATLQAPFIYLPHAPWLQDALRTTAEALALAASRTLDVDPAELSAGHRLLPLNLDGNACFDLYLFDTASGGAGYAAEAGAEIETILKIALDVVESCPRQCERSCTRCLRHYGNRFWHSTLDRKLASQILRHLIYGETPTPLTFDEQYQQLMPLRRFLELEGWQCSSSEQAPLLVQQGYQQLMVGTFHALLEQAPPQKAGLSGSRMVMLRDYIVNRDLPAAYAELRQYLGSK